MYGLVHCEIHGQIFYFAFNKNICREIGNISDFSLCTITVSMRNLDNLQSWIISRVFSVIQELSRTALNLSDSHSTPRIFSMLILTLGHCYPLILESDVFSNCQENKAPVSYTAIPFFTITTIITSPALVMYLAWLLYLCLFNEWKRFV